LRDECIDALHHGKNRRRLPVSLEFILSRRSIRKYAAVPVMERDVDDLLRAAVENLLLGVPSHVVPLALIPIGHPAESKPPGGRFNVHRIHRNRW
jgi:nitroreductase